MSTIHYKQVLQKEGVVADVLSDKAKRKILEYEKIFANPIYKNKKTGQFHAASQIKLDDLNEDIIDLIYIYLEEQADSKTELERLEADRIAAEEQAAKDKEAAEAEAERIAAEEAERNNSNIQHQNVVKKTSWWDEIWG